jgi:DNA-binding sugar fermentation-stimulating protein
MQLSDYCSVTFSFIMVGEDRLPLEGEEALALLRDTGALQELRNRGYQGVQFTTLDPPTTEAAAVLGA